MRNSFYLISLLFFIVLSLASSQASTKESEIFDFSENPKIAVEIFQDINQDIYAPPGNSGLLLYANADGETIITFKKEIIQNIKTYPSGIISIHLQANPSRGICCVVWKNQANPAWYKLCFPFRELILANLPQDYLFTVGSHPDWQQGKDLECLQIHFKEMKPNSEINIKSIEFRPSSFLNWLERPRPSFLKFRYLASFFAVFLFLPILLLSFFKNRKIAFKYLILSWWGILLGIFVMISSFPFPVFPGFRISAAKIYFSLPEITLIYLLFFALISMVWLDRKNLFSFLKLNLVEAFLLLFLGIAILSLIGKPISTHTNWFIFKSWLPGFLIYSLARRLPDPEYSSEPQFFSHKNLIRAMVIIASVIAGETILEFICQNHLLYFDLYLKYPEHISTDRLFRVAGPLIHPLSLAAYLILFIPIAIGFAVNSRKNLTKTLWIAATILLIASLALSLSRGAWLALILSLFVLWQRFPIEFLLEKIAQRKIFISALMIVFLTASFLTLWNIVQPHGKNGKNENNKEKLSRLYEPAPAVTGLPPKPADSEALQDRLLEEDRLLHSESLANRLIAYQITWNALKKRPWLGIGIGHYLKAMANSEISSAGAFWTDNAFLRLTCETGLLGILIFFSLIILVLKLAWQGLNNFNEPLTTKEKNQYKLALMKRAIMAGLIAFILDSFLFDTFYTQPPTFAFWLIAGLISKKIT